MALTQTRPHERPAFIPFKTVITQWAAIGDDFEIRTESSPVGTEPAPLGSISLVWTFVLGLGTCIMPRLWPPACSSRTSLGRVAQCPMVLESHLSLCRIGRHHGQAMAE